MGSETSLEAQGSRLRVPIPALVLTAGGVVPFLFLTFAAWIGFEPFGRSPVSVLALYSLAILSFVGAVHWGLAMSQPQPNATWSYLASVVPALVGWFALAFLPVTVALRVIAITFAILMLYDLRAARIMSAPAWYPIIRVPATLLVVISLLLASIVS